MTAKATVHILTYCRRPELFYGTELIFKTLRVGFPEAEVVVTDNASVPEVRPTIRKLALGTGCEHRQLTEEVAHNTFIERTLYRAAQTRNGGAERPLVFLDPDVCLWRSCEEFEFDSLLAGRLIAASEDARAQCIMMPRIHTSFMWIPSPVRLVEEVNRIRSVHFDFDPFLSFSAKMGQAWIRYDTGASLFSAIPDRITPFGEVHLEHFDHIFCGSHFDLVEDTYTEGARAVMRQLHEDAKAGRLENLKGAWRTLDALWRQEYTRIE